VDERELIERVGRLIGSEHVRDDCAVFTAGGATLVASTDMLHETTDFPAGMTDWQIGWMSAAVTLSDIAGMGARPLLLLLATGLDRPERLMGITEGALACCEHYGATLAGGDTDAHSECTIVSTGIGVAEEGHVVRRRGSVPGDLICITGIPGCAQAGLSGYTEHRKALLEPQPGVREGPLLAKAGATAMMDVSDGLVISLYDLLKVNDCGYALRSDKIPEPAGVPPLEALEMALYGGGDFGLLFTCPPDMMPVDGVEATVVGEVIAERKVLVDGEEVERRGYMHGWGG